MGQNGHYWCWAHHRTAPHSHECGFCLMCTGLVLFWNKDRKDILVKESLWFDAILQTQATFVNSSLADTTWNQQWPGSPHFPARKKLFQLQVSLQKDLPDTQYPFLPGYRTSGGSWQKPTGKEVLTSKCYWETLTWSSLAEEVLQFQTSLVSFVRPEGALLQSSQMPFWPPYL